MSKSFQILQIWLDKIIVVHVVIIAGQLAVDYTASWLLTSQSLRLALFFLCIDYT